MPRHYLITVVNRQFETVTIHGYYPTVLDVIEGLLEKLDMNEIISFRVRKRLTRVRRK